MSDPINLPALIDRVAALEAAAAQLLVIAGAKNAEAQAAISKIEAFLEQPTLEGDLNLNGHRIRNQPTSEFAEWRIVIEGQGIELISPDTVIHSAAFPSAIASTVFGEQTTLLESDNGRVKEVHSDVAAHAFAIPSGLPANYHVLVRNPHLADVSYAPADGAETLAWANGAPAQGSAYPLMWLVRSAAGHWVVY